MAIRIVKLGSPRGEGEGLRIGTVRRPPRGVPKDEFASRDFYDVWFPNLAPSQALLKEAFPIADDSTWRVFRRRFLAEMREPGARHALDLLAALSHGTRRGRRLLLRGRVALSPFPAQRAAARAGRRAGLSRRALGQAITYPMSSKRAASPVAS